jgi:xylan 1,4-beta-xylosidase
MLGMMKGQRVAVNGTRMYDLKTIVDSSVRKKINDVGALAAKDKKMATVLLWNYHDDDVKSPAIPVSVNITGLPAKSVKLIHYRIDDLHSNSYAVWKKMGSPQNPSATQISILENAGQLQTMGKAEKLKVSNRKLQLSVVLPAQGVSLLKLNW